MHQAEKYAKKVVDELSHNGYLNEFMQTKKDQQAVRDVAAALKKLDETLLAPQKIHLKGYSVPLGALALYHYVREELELMERAFEEKSPEWGDLNETQYAMMEQRFAIVRERQEELLDSLVRRNVADQLEQRVDPAKAYASLRDEGFLPLHLDEITTDLSDVSSERLGTTITPTPVIGKTGMPYTDITLDTGRPDSSYPVFCTHSSANDASSISFPSSMHSSVPTG